MRIIQAIAGLQILILLLLFCFGSLHVSQFHVCDFFNLCFCSNILQKSGHFCFAALPKRPKDRGGCVHHDYEVPFALQI